MVEALDEADLFALEAALDALEDIHDFQADVIGSQHVRQCLCREASAWHNARKVTILWRRNLGLKVRLVDTV